ncbi:MAG: hypothetical protein ACM3Q4_13260 [Acidobacteriota bacterium]
MKCVRQRHAAMLAIALIWLGMADVCRGQEAAPAAGIHRVFEGRVEGFNVWIVDGKNVRETLIPEFLYGGNALVYPAIPSNEIWIDHAISCEEFQYTLRHELRERQLILEHQWTYGAAHDSALMLEDALRRNDLRLAREHERLLPNVGSSDFYGVKELPALADSIRLDGCYRVYVGRRDSLEIWIVDGSAIRRDIYPDFGLSGNDLAYHFIPPKEIWLDSDISCEEMEFSIRFELAERALIAGGLAYDDAYQKALDSIRRERLDAARKVLH